MEPKKYFPKTKDVSANEIKPGDVIVRKNGVYQEKVRQVFKFGFGNEVDVQFESYRWEKFNKDRILKIKVDEEGNKEDEK